MHDKQYGCEFNYGNISAHQRRLMLAP
jgi:hypothetical protein